MNECLALSYAEAARGFRPLHESIPLKRAAPVMAPMPELLLDYDGTLFYI